MTSIASIDQDSPLYYEPHFIEKQGPFKILFAAIPKLNTTLFDRKEICSDVVKANTKHPTIRRIQEIAKALGYTGQLEIRAADFIKGHGGTFSLSKHVLLCPERTLNAVDEFLIAKEIAKFKSADGLKNFSLELLQFINQFDIRVASLSYNSLISYAIANAVSSSLLICDPNPKVHLMAAFFISLSGSWVYQNFNNHRWQEFSVAAFMRRMSISSTPFIPIATMLQLAAFAFNPVSLLVQRKQVYDNDLAAAKAIGFTKAKYALQVLKTNPKRDSEQPGVFMHTFFSWKWFGIDLTFPSFFLPSIQKREQYILDKREEIMSAASTSIAPIIDDSQADKKPINFDKVVQPFVQPKTSWFDSLYDLFPYLWSAGNSHNRIINEAPNFIADGGFEKKIQQLCNKCGYIGRKFSYYLNNKIEGYGGYYSITAPILTGPTKEFDDVEEFLLAKKIHQIKLQDAMDIVAGLTPFLGAAATFMPFFTIAQKVAIVFGSAMFSYLFSKYNQTSREFLTDLETAKSIGFKQSIAALEKIKQDKKYALYSNAIGKRIEYLKSFSWLEDQKT